MGHAARANDMSAIYRQGVDDARLQAVVDHVHDWLYGQADGTADEGDTEAGDEPQDGEKLRFRIVG